jgi:pimeloyl-ACP methyl ester carboxylesterase
VGLTRAQILALPGLLCDDFVWRAQADALGDIADFTIADFRQFDNLTAMARSALELVEGQAHVVGHSMGGRVAFEIWRLAPERVRSLVVLDTGVHATQPGEAASRQRLLDISAHQTMSDLADAWLPPMVHPMHYTDEAIMEPLRQMVRRADHEQHARQINALVTRPDATALLATIRVPTLVIVGRQDEWSPVAQHEQITDAITGARLEVIEDSGHFVTVERPDEVTSLLGEWLAGFDGRGSV